MQFTNRVYTIDQPAKNFKNGRIMNIKKINLQKTKKQENRKKKCKIQKAS